MKKIIGILFSLVFVLSLSVTVFAQSENATISEKNGDYPDPERPGRRIRVFVHEPKPSKPSQTQPALLVCPKEDPDSTAVIPPVGWKLPSTWTYTLNPGSVPSSVGGSNLAAIANNAFNVWTSAVENKVTITRTSFNTTVNRARYDGKNIIAWGRTSAGALAVTYTWYYPGGFAVEEDTIFNKQYRWFWNSSNNTCTDSNSYDAQDILTHELGHWMGLNDVYDAVNYQNATMYGYGSKGEVKKNTLTTGDVQGVQAIYTP